MPSKRGTSIERDNPFRPGGEIEREAEDMLRSSTISGDRVSIVDPSTPKNQRNSGVGTGASSPDTTDSSKKVVGSINSDSSNSPLTHTSNTNGHTPDDNKGITATETTDDSNKDKSAKKKRKKMCQIV